MTREELLDIGVIIPDTLDLDKLHLFSNLGCRVLLHDISKDRMFILIPSNEEYEYDNFKYNVPRINIKNVSLVTDTSNIDIFLPRTKMLIYNDKVIVGAYISTYD